MPLPTEWIKEMDYHWKR